MQSLLNVLRAAGYSCCLDGDRIVVSPSDSKPDVSASDIRWDLDCEASGLSALEIETVDVRELPGGSYSVSMWHAGISR